MQALVLGLNPFNLGLALHPVPIVGPHLYLLSNALEHIPSVVLFVELVMGLSSPQMTVRSIKSL